MVSLLVIGIIILVFKLAGLSAHSRSAASYTSRLASG